MSLSLQEEEPLIVVRRERSQLVLILLLMFVAHSYLPYSAELFVRIMATLTKVGDAEEGVALTTTTTTAPAATAPVATAPAVIIPAGSAPLSLSPPLLPQKLTIMPPLHKESPQTRRRRPLVLLPGERIRLLFLVGRGGGSRGGLSP